MNNINSVFLLVLITAVLCCCDKKVAKVAIPPVIKSEDCDTVTYTKHIESIIVNECMNCHTAQSPNLSSYASVKNILENGKLKTYVIDRQVKPMPPGNSLPQGQKDLIQCWINNGGKEQ
jgi:uncharacterized membrane protein